MGLIWGGKPRIGSLFGSTSISILILVLMVAVFTAFLSIISGVDITSTYYWIIWGGFSPHQIPETLLRSSPILITAAGLVAPYMARIWNVGAEGQLILGALGSSWLGLHLSGLGLIGIVVLILFGGLCGLAWALLPSFLKIYRGSNEVFTTLMMNYIAMYLASYLLNGPLRSGSSLFPETDLISGDLWLEPVIPGTRIHAGVLVSLIALPIAVHMLVGRSLIGLRLRILGAGEAQASYFGVDVKRIVILSMSYSGFMAGVAGSLEVLGVHHKALLSISQGYGYLAIPAAVTSGSNGLALLAISIGLGGVINGVTTAQMMLGIPSGSVYILQGLFLIASLVIVRVRG